MNEHPPTNPEHEPTPERRYQRTREARLPQRAAARKCQWPAVLGGEVDLRVKADARRRTSLYRRARRLGATRPPARER